MTSRMALLIGALAIGQPAAAQAQNPLDQKMSEPLVHAGLFAWRDGERTGSATLTVDVPGGSDSGVVYIAPCGSMGAANAGLPISSSATDVWQLSARALTMTGEQASVQISWQRIRRDGHDEESAPQSQSVVLHRGEPIELDRIEVPASGACDARTASLDLLYISYNDRQQQRAAARAAGGGTSASSATASGEVGTVPPDVATSAVVSGSGRVFFNSSGEVISVAASGAGRPAPTRPVAELWLVRSTPGRSDETVRTSAQVLGIPRPFAFDPITIQMASGVLNITVQGTVETGQSPEGEPRFYLSANRETSFVPSDRPVRDAASRTEGSTKTTVAMPGPDEVLSFEMPPIQSNGITLPDRLSIRVRIAPQPMQQR